ncbi:MAG: type II secretion system F family protein [Candidatus Adlerbacteria bacterium]|nr:type II secretion system F family protein [Candidatus Adlerbacteria bacterium]
MSEFKYEGLDQTGKPQSGTANAPTQDAAVEALQRRGLTLTSISPINQDNNVRALLNNTSFFGGVSNRDVVLLSRQLATLFEAQVSALRVFRLLAEQAEKPFLRKALTDVGDDLQSGDSISKALAKHPKVFSDFYVNMVRAGEESGKLDQTFLFLADYIDRSYELTGKARNALIYPAFIMVTFVAVMTLMLTVVIPKIGSILEGDGQQLPLFTQIILSFSAFLTDYGIFILIALIVGGYFLYRYAQTPTGKLAMSRFKLSIPYVGELYRKLYLSRFADNMHVMLTSGISAVRSLEVTSSVIENQIYEGIILEALEGVKAGRSISETFSHYPQEIPSIMVQMLKIGEETGELGNILQRMAKFYNREVNAAVDTLVSLIEPALIVALALGVGFLLAAVLLPIYNSTANI